MLTAPTFFADAGHPNARIDDDLNERREVTNRYALIAFAWRAKNHMPPNDSDVRRALKTL